MNVRMSKEIIFEVFDFLPYTDVYIVENKLFLLAAHCLVIGVVIPLKIEFLGRRTPLVRKNWHKNNTFVSLRSKLNASFGCRTHDHARCPTEVWLDYRLRHTSLFFSSEGYTDTKSILLGLF
jgi:hypothetical protein